MKYKPTRGYTLIELIVSVGLFALIMTLAAGAYLTVIGVSRQTQGITSGIDNLSFALETMTRTIRTGTNYSCALAPSTNCWGGSTGSTFYIKDTDLDTVSYTLVPANNGNGVIQQTTTDHISGNTVTSNLTDPTSINITSLEFYSTGVAPFSDQQDQKQARVTIVISGTVASGVAKGQTIPFTVETGATMRGSDI